MTWTVFCRAGIWQTLPAGFFVCLLGCQTLHSLKGTAEPPPASLAPSSLAAAPEIARLPRIEGGEEAIVSAFPSRNRPSDDAIVRQVAWQQPGEAEAAPGDLPVLESTEVIPRPQALPAGGLTILALEEMAMRGNPSLAEARARVEAARGKWVQVGLLPNTELGYSGQQLGSNGQAEQNGVYLAQEFVRGGKLRLNREVVAQEIQKAEQAWATQQQRVQTDVRLNAYAVLVAQRRNEIADRLAEIARQSVETAEALQQAQEVSQLDVVRTRVELQTAELLLKNARNRYTAAWKQLTAVLGSPGLPPQPLQGNLEEVNGELDPEQVLARLIAQSPEMAAALIEVQRARWAVDRAIAEPSPNVDVQAIVQQDNGIGGTDANLQVSLPIPWLNRNQGGIRQAHAEVDAAARAVDRLELSFQERLASVFQRYASARNQVVDYSRKGGILENAGVALQYVRQGYQAGEVGYLDLITAQRTYSQTNLAYVEALGDLWAAKIEIDGLLLKGSLDTLASP
ncbi:TolC family protein [Lignipirellula cremea]|uniref:Cobalt-zinc-cadmium resistance protein CzcC n=1 Tax=Lignipirellula cremea TaxID=2528010 RepID=A0A518DT85_9BACT|nr:TolC family protein [Lignipirellula cremea]QDU95056.1 Cobalt-zinc-cadmium resistance protein CzcC precursor [Lignipirellula cremea]